MRLKRRAAVKAKAAPEAKPVQRIQPWKIMIGRMMKETAAPTSVTHVIFQLLASKKAISALKISLVFSVIPRQYTNTIEIYVKLR